MKTFKEFVSEPLDVDVIEESYFRKASAIAFSTKSRTAGSKSIQQLKAAKAKINPSDSFAASLSSFYDSSIEQQKSIDALTSLVSISILAKRKK